MTWSNKIAWALLSLLGAGSLAILAFSRGEPVNATWIVVAALCTYFISYRFYARFLARKVLQVDPQRPTPAQRLNDGLDFVPTHKNVLFGHHFAAIAGAGPLVGPVLAAQMGYLPGILWILAGVVLAGAVQDTIILFLSVRRDGSSLGEMVRMEMGQTAGALALVGVLLIMIIILAVLALVVVKALTDSAWGTFTVFATVPIAVVMGIYGRLVRRGRVAEMSVLGAGLLMAALIFGRTVSESAWLAPYFTFSAVPLALILIAYGFVASVTPIWLVLAPRDYLSTFLKIGAIAALAVGIVATMPVLKMPALTQFVGGHGPVFSGGLFPYSIPHHFENSLHGFRSGGVMNGLFHFFLGLSGAFLDSANKFVLFTFLILKIVVSEVRPFLFELAFEDIPIAFDFEFSHNSLVGLR